MAGWVRRDRASGPVPTADVDAFVAVNAVTGCDL